MSLVKLHAMTRRAMFTTIAWVAGVLPAIKQIPGQLVFSPPNPEVGDTIVVAVPLLHCFEPSIHPEKTIASTHSMQQGNTVVVELQQVGGGPVFAVLVFPLTLLTSP